MKSILILLASLLLIPFIYYAYAGSSGGINEDIGASTFHTESDDNANLSYVPGYGNLSNLDPEDITIGSANEVNNTKSSLIENTDPSVDPINPIQEYKSNSSDWNIELGTDPDLNRSFVTNLSKQ